MKIILFGAGEVCRLLLEKFSAMGIGIECILDNDPQKIGTDYYGIPVFSPVILGDMNFNGKIILITPEIKHCYTEIAEQLKSYGLKENVHYHYGVKRFPTTDRIGYVSGFVSLGDEFFVHKSNDPEARTIEMLRERRIFHNYSGKHALRLEKVYERLLKSNLLKDVVGDVNIAQDAPLSTPADSLLVEMEFIEPFNYPGEWPPLMFKDYVLWMLDCIKKLDQAGLAFLNPNPFNATFYQGNFILTSLDDIHELKMDSLSFLLLLNTHIIPLLLMHKKQMAKAYVYLNTPSIACSFADLQGYLNEREIAAWQGLMAECRSLMAKGDVAGACDSLSAYARALNFDSFFERWQEYQAAKYESVEWDAKQQGVAALVAKAAPRTMIDLAGNMGWYALALSRRMDYAITVDYSRDASDAAYRYTRERGAGNVLPLFFNFLSPLSAMHDDLHIDSASGIAPWRKSGPERLRCDLALALAVMHHLAFSQRLGFAEIIATLSQWTKRWLLLEYIDISDIVMERETLNGFDWYTRHNFERALQDKFTIIDTHPSYVPTRTLYLCELADIHLSQAR